jgi:hypothetical protein
VGELFAASSFGHSHELILASTVDAALQERDMKTSMNQMTAIVVGAILSILVARSAEAAVVEVEVTVKSVDAKARGITVNYEVSGKPKSIDLDVSRKAAITVNGKQGTLDAVKPGQKAKVSFEKDLQVVTKIDATGSGTASDDADPFGSGTERPGEHQSAGNRSNSSGKATELKYDDGKPDGKRSFGGSGEMIEFTVPNETGKITGIRIHGSRYGMPQPPAEPFVVYGLGKDMSEVLFTETAPYKLFQRGPEKWVDVKFKKVHEVPKTFWIVLDFKAHQTKGVFVSYDTSTGGKHSKVGLPGGEEPKGVEFGGDWMIRALLAD